MSDVAELDEVIARGRRDALEVLSQMAEVVGRVMDVFELIVAPGAEDGTPVEWPLPEALQLERSQLVAFVETVKRMTPERQQAFREVFVVELTKAKQTAGYRATHELPTVPMLPETRAAGEELAQMFEDVKRAVMFDRELADAVRPVTMVRRTLAPGT